MQSRDSLRNSPEMHCKISVALAPCARSSNYDYYYYYYDVDYDDDDDDDDDDDYYYTKGV